jgi:hypothetical protein
MRELSGTSPDALECSALSSPKYTTATLNIPSDLSRTRFSLSVFHLQRQVQSGGNEIKKIKKICGDFQIFVGHGFSRAVKYIE